MESEFFLNAGITPVPPMLPLHFDPLTSSNSPPMPAWRSLPHSSSAMDMNNANREQSPADCFFGNPNWDRSTDHHTGALQYESALSSMVSSPAASNSNISTERFMIKELIGKLGNIGGGHGNHNPGEISPHLAAAASSYGGSANNSCYSTPLSSPPKLSLPRMDQFVKTIGLNSNVAEFSADPGFAERAARFSCFGSRSFNGRIVQVSGGGGGCAGLNCSPAMNGNISGGKLPRVSSSPSLKALGSQKGNKGSPSPLQDVGELGNSSASPEESSLSEQRIPNSGGVNGSATATNEPNPRKRKAAPKGKAKESAAAQPNASTAKQVETNENPSAKRSKGNGNNESKSAAKAVEEEAAAGDGGGGEEKQSKCNNNNNDSKPAEPLKDYIHVRARRGQATDSHSLAERVRREKISERMKLLQDLVPGCNKVTGKALMLDEIINYVQSLQRQVEFLSMKLASVNTRLDFNIDSLSSKDMYQRNNSSGMPHPMFAAVDSSASAILGHHQNGSGSNSNSSSSSSLSNGTATHSVVGQLDPTAALFSAQNLTLHCPLDPFSHSLTHDQFQSFCDDDLQSIVQMGFAQNPANGPDTDYSGSSPNHQASSHVKVEI